MKLFIGILTSAPELLADLECSLCADFGTIDLRSPTYAFTATEYYDREMGVPLERSFWAFRELVAPESIAAVKTRTNEVEADFASRQSRVSRPVNLDPGYLEHGKVVLASTKNFSHRILVSGGIYAEVTLHYRAGAWQTYPWTFPDYRSGHYHAFFSELRRMYRAQLGH